jgi:hypothetical protein
VFPWEVITFEKGTIEKKVITLDPNLFLLHSFPRVTTDVNCVRDLNEHNEVLLRDNLGRNESWLANELHWLALRSDFSIGYSNT